MILGLDIGMTPKVPSITTLTGGIRSGTYINSADMCVFLEHSLQDP
jgi:hypothetical protein